MPTPRPHQAMNNLDELLRQRLHPIGDWQPSALRLAAVLCPLLRVDDEEQLLFVARPAGLRQHPGQIAFPGGMRDAGESPLQTALRECREEIGAPEDALTVLGSLPPRESSTGILVHCIVARLRPMPLRPDPSEVDEVLHVPLADLRDLDRWQERPPRGPHFQLGPHVLWGLTARFVRDLHQQLGAY